MIDKNQIKNIVFLLRGGYPPKSAGRRMIENVPLAFSEERVLDVKNKLLEKIKDYETINYIYVVDKQKKLIGVFSIKELFGQSEKIKVGEMMKTEIVKVRPRTDQERVAILALKHNLKAIPVVDKEDNFLGVVTSDVILDILHSEDIEDFLRTAGIHSPVAETLKGNSLILTKIRIPWLIFGLLGGIFAAQIVGFFETPLKSHFILAAFIPLIVYIADAVGSQTGTLFIRSLVLNNQLGIKKYLLREIKTSILMGLILGSFLLLLSIFWFDTPYFIGIILGVSLFFTILIAILIGIIIPFLLQKLKKDPALGSGPLATIITDITSLVIYFSTATLLLKIF